MQKNVSGLGGAIVYVPTGPLIRRRMALLLSVFLGLFLLLGGRLAELAGPRSAELRARAERQWTREAVISARRGTIYDRTGQALALSATATTVCVSPRQVKDLKALAKTLAPILDMGEEAIEKKASDRSKGGVTLKRQVSSAVARELRDMMAAQEGDAPLTGLYLEEDAKRYYPLGDFASQLIGLTTIDGVGQSGLEQSLNAYLSGRAGSVLGEIDGKGRSLGTQETYVPGVDGSSVTLTIDSAIQSIVEQAAREAMTVDGAKGVRALVMDPNSGAILALCVKPSFDLNEPPRGDVQALNELMRNRVVSDAYEPGSTFKVVTTACALESGVTRVDEGFYCSGSVVVDGGRIKCWGRPHGAESMARALENSCNPVFVELGLRLGVNRFYDYLDAFGLGKRTGTDVPGEMGGILISRARCKRVDIARIGFGQSVAVTPLQLLAAGCAAVNGGKLLRPYVVQEIRSPEGEVLLKGGCEVVSRPISEKTSATVRTLLEGVVKNGGGKNAYLAQYRVGGKTGTAQRYVNGVVSSTSHIGSFMGFAPIDDPRIAVLFIVDEASLRPDFGSVTAAPFAKQIIERTLIHLGVPQEAGSREAAPTRAVPDVTGMTVEAARAALAEAGFSALLEGAGAIVFGQLPAAGAKMAEGSQVCVYSTREPEQERVQAPDVAGLTIGEAARLLGSAGLRMRMNGSGLAARQAPCAGASCAKGDTIEVFFEKPGAP